MTKERRQILDVLENSTDAMSPSEVAGALGKPANNIKKRSSGWPRPGRSRKTVGVATALRNARLPTQQTAVTLVTSVTFMKKVFQNKRLRIAREVTMSLRDSNFQRSGNLSGYRFRPENGKEIKGSGRKVTEVTKVTGNFLRIPF